MNLLDPEVLFRIVDVTGVFFVAMIGGAVARSKGFDPVGFVVLAITTALGGGITRDLMLGVSFPVALTDPWYLSSAVVAAAIAFTLEIDGSWRKLLAVADMLALGCWSATGSAKAMAAGLGILPAVMLGVITAVFGGVIRDMMINQVPAIFGGSPMYASFAALSALQMAVLYQFGHYQLGMAIAIVFCCVFGLLAQRRNWTLPSAASLTVGAFVPVGRGRQRPATRRNMNRSHKGDDAKGAGVTDESPGT